MNSLAADTPLGRNGLRVGAMAYWVAALGNLLRPVPQQEWEGAVPAAWQSGVRYFDVAPHYGLGLAERRLGLALRGRPRDEFLISTKVGRLLRPVRTPLVRATTRDSMSRPTSSGFGTTAATGSAGRWSPAWSDSVSTGSTSHSCTIPTTTTPRLSTAHSLPWKSSGPRA